MTAADNVLKALHSHADSKVMLESPFTVMLYGCIVELKMIDDRTVKLEKILNVTERGEGRGSRALRVICDSADLNGVTLIGIMRSFDGGLSNEQLVGWYSRNGFEITADKIIRRPCTLLPTTGQRSYVELFGRVRVEKTDCGLAVSDEEYTYNFNRDGVLVDQVVRAGE